MSPFTSLWRKTVFILVIAIVILQVIHMILVSQLEAKRNARNRHGFGYYATSDNSESDPLDFTSDGRHAMSMPDYTDEFYSDADIMRDRAELIRNMAESSVLDASGQYHIINYLSRGLLSASDVRNLIRPDLCLVTHSTVNQLHHFLDIVDSWSGPVSVAVFATDTGQVSRCLEMILLMNRCIPKVRLSVTFHLVYPFRRESHAEQESSSSPWLEENYHVGCSNRTAIYALLKSLSKTKQDSHKNYVLERGAEYPNNLLRNVGRRNALTEFVLVMDVDLIPSNGLYESFIKFAASRGLFSSSSSLPQGEASRNELDPQAVLSHLFADSLSAATKTVFVIPTFEMNISSGYFLHTKPNRRSHLKMNPQHMNDLNNKVPRSKQELISLYASSPTSLRPFYMELCWRCQMHTDYETWISQPETASLDILYEVLWREPWEPFYIGPNSVPAYDERFRQYGFNRISQLCELHVAGYKFAVLNNPFLIHKGLKRPDSFHADKDLEQERNRAHYQQLKALLKARYPNSTRSCY